MRQTLGFLVVCLLTSVLVGAFDAAVIVKTLRQRATADFVSTSGNITHSELIVEERPREGQEVRKHLYRADVRYTYEVDGQSFTGRGHRVDIYSSGDRRHAQDVVDRYRNGRQVRVYYDPDDPARSVLERDVGTPSRWLMGATAPLTFGLIGLWGWYVRATKRQSLPDDVPPVPRRERGGVVHVSLPRFSPIEMTWGMAMWTCIGGMIIIGVWREFDLLRGMMVLSIAALGVAVLTYAWQHLAASRRELIIDRDLDQLTLPRTFGRKQRVAVALDAVISVRLRTIRHGSGSETTETFAPTLTWSDGTREIDERLAHWSDADKANRFTRWLASELHGRS
jgi:hypothetical protein